MGMVSGIGREITVIRIYLEMRTTMIMSMHQKAIRGISGYGGEIFLLVIPRMRMGVRRFCSQTARHVVRERVARTESARREAVRLMTVSAA